MQVQAWQRSGQRCREAIVGALARCDRHASIKGRAGEHKGVRARFVWWSALPMLVTLPAVAHAQQPSGAVRASASPIALPSTEQPNAAENDVVSFSADQVTYDNDADVVTASGEVRMNRAGNYLAADRVI